MAVYRAGVCMNNAIEDQAPKPGKFVRLTQGLMALCLGVMAVSVFVNVVLRYGFGSGIPASEELGIILSSEKLKFRINANGDI